MTFKRSLSLLVHGESKVGKTTLAVTAPGPRLLLDVEAAHRFVINPAQTVYWDPKTSAAPECDGSWDTCVVPVRTYEDMQEAYKYLKLGRHCFSSLIIDSISELQVKLIDQIVGPEQIRMQQWGQLFRALSDMLRGMRDLTMHPTNPLEAVVLTAMTKDGQDGKKHPFLQGQVQVVAPYLFDILGYLRVEEYPHPDPTMGTYRVRRLYVEATDFAEAGERVQGRLGSIVEQDDLSIETMLDKIYGSVPTAVATTE